MLKNPEKSDRAIAEEAGVHHATVAKARKKQLDTTIQLRGRTGRDGKTRTGRHVIRISSGVIEVLSA